jgi:endonuclease/exonuclease/phosphatase family metal-dependent hydrolase
MREKLMRSDSEIICCPEAPDNFLDAAWHGVFSDPDYGYPQTPGRRKVTLWSKRPWRDVDMIGSPDLPSGRFVAATTSTSFGDVRVIGVCIPWRMAHVATGRRDRTTWQDHRTYLAGLKDALESAAALPCILVGDFNQRIPPAREQRELSEMLHSALSGFRIWTATAIRDLASQPVCHIGGSAHFDLVQVSGISRVIDGATVSDHDGIVAEVPLH